MVRDILEDCPLCSFCSHRMQVKLRGNPILSGGIKITVTGENCHIIRTSLRWPGCHVHGINAESSIPDFYRGDEEWRYLDWWDDEVRRSNVCGWYSW